MVKKKKINEKRMYDMMKSFNKKGDNLFKEDPKTIKYLSKECIIETGVAELKSISALIDKIDNGNKNAKTSSFVNHAQWTPYGNMMYEKLQKRYLTQ